MESWQWIFVFFAVLMVAYEVLSALLSYYRGFVLPHRYGLSVQKLWGWLGDMAKAGILSLIFGAGIIAAMYWFLTNFPSLWWLLGWALITLLSLLLTNLAPIIVVPLFFKMKHIIMI